MNQESIEFAKLFGFITGCFLFFVFVFLHIALKTSIKLKCKANSLPVALKTDDKRGVPIEVHNETSNRET